ALLRNQLVRRRQLHAELALHRQDLEERAVILEVGAGAIAPRIPLAAARGNSELVTDATMAPLGDRFRRLDGETVGVVRFAVFPGCLESLESARRFVSDRHDLEAHHVHVARLARAEVVGDAEPLAAFLA